MRSFSSDASTQHSSSFVFFKLLRLFFRGEGGGGGVFREFEERVGESIAGSPMSSKSTFKCLHCNEIHLCEPRNRGRQRSCPEPACRRAAKAKGQREWLLRPENEDYFRGAGNCERVRQWRKAHPGYWRKKTPAPKGALQDPLVPQKRSQGIDNESIELQNLPGALQEGWQESCHLQPALLVGLVSFLTGNALQEDIALSVRSLLERGKDILRTVPRGQ